MRVPSATPMRSTSAVMAMAMGARRTPPIASEVTLASATVTLPAAPVPGLEPLGSIPSSSASRVESSVVPAPVSRMKS